MPVLRAGPAGLAGQIGLGASRACRESDMPKPSGQTKARKAAQYDLDSRKLEKQPMRTLANRRLRAQGKAQLRRDGGAGDVWA